MAARKQGLRALPTPTAVLVTDEGTARAVPKAPKDLGRAGLETWHVVHAHAPALTPTLDVLTVHRLAQLADERAAVTDELERGALLAEPIVSPLGVVVGERLVANPASATLRALDKEIDALSDRLGLTPAARAKLGVSVSLAERQALEVKNLLEAKYHRGSA